MKQILSPGYPVWLSVVLLCGLLGSMSQPAYSQEEKTEAKPAAKPLPPAPPEKLLVEDKPWDGGTNIDLSFALSPDDKKADEHKIVRYYLVEIAGEKGGLFKELPPVVPEVENYENRRVTMTLEKLVRNEPYYFRVRAIGKKVDTTNLKSVAISTTEPTIPTRQSFDSSRLWLLIIIVVVCGAVIIYIGIARTGKDLKVRKIAGLEAIDEAVGRATEMGRSCVYVPGIQDISDIQTIAGMTILSRVAKTAAEYDAKVEVPTSKSLVMTTARETVQAAFLTAGRPDAYNEDNIYYVTDEQFGYVAHLSGMMVRDKPAACFYMGAFFAESLILAETGNSIGAIQVAGTAQPAQLPFFVAACDYTLIGEEFFAASAYLSGDPDQLGSLKGQDVGKIVVGGLLVIGCLLATLANVTNVEIFADALHYLKFTVLK